MNDMEIISEENSRNTNPKTRKPADGTIKEGFGRRYLMKPDTTKETAMKIMKKGHNAFSGKKPSPASCRNSSPPVWSRKTEAK